MNNLDDYYLITEEINTSGFYCVENFIGIEDLNLCKAEIENLRNKYSNNFFTILNICDDKNSVFNNFKVKYQIDQIAKNISSANDEIRNGDDRKLNVLRVINEDSKNRNSLKFHFDASAVTILVPIEIPNCNDYSGDLIFFPNLRSFNTPLIVNLLTKFLFQNLIFRKMLFLLIKDKLSKHILKLKPGSVYIFWGYRSLHANMSISTKINRSTLIFHHNFIHSHSLVLRFVKYIRARVEISRLKNN